MKESPFWKVYAWIYKGKQRRLVIKELTDRPITAQEFRKRLNSKLQTSSQLSLREVSRHFTSFAEKGIVTIKCLCFCESSSTDLCNTLKFN